MTNQTAVIFLHIAKTGGTTLRSIIQKQFAKHEVYDLDPSYFVSDAKQYQSVMQQRLANLKAMSESEKGRFRCFFHPAAYGLHEILPQPSQYFTFLRDPIDHFVSSYYFAVNNPGHIQHDTIMRENLSLEGFAELFPIDNLQTRRLSGVDPIDQLNNLKPNLADADLGKAKDNLAQMPIFGLMEHYDESMLLIQERFLWKDVSYTAKNVAPKRMTLQDLPQQLKQKLEKQLAFDIELYHFAEERFKEHLAASKLEMEAALKRYTKQNQRLSQKLAFKKKLISLLRFRSGNS